MNHIKDLRGYLAALKAIGELQEIDAEVDWNLELAAICRRAYETESPAPLFNRIKDIETGFRVLGAPAGVSRQPGLRLARVALSLGLDARAGGQEIVLALADAAKRAPIPPRIVASGPCQENVLLGDAIDLLRFPTPLCHDGDGGRYIGTYGTIVARSPDGTWTNWSIARVMIVGKDTMTGIVSPLQHLGMLHKMWKDRGQPMPFALCLGTEPGIPFVGGMSLPAFVDEGAYLGGYFGEPLDVVACKTVELEVPATSEIVIEGLLSNVDTAPEGPMGEYAGYHPGGPPTSKPLYRVTAITHRNDPILPVVIAGEPIEEDHTAQGIPSSAATLALLRERGIPASLVWCTLESANHWLVVTMPMDWRKSLDISDEELLQRTGRIIFEESKFGPVVPKVIMVNDDIDPTNLRELVWAFATRNHPGPKGQLIFGPELTSPLVAFLESPEKAAFQTTKVVYNCLPPADWGHRIPTRASFRASYPASLQKHVLDSWSKYGFR